MGDIENLSTEEKLHRVADATNSDGTVDVQLLDWGERESQANTLTVEFLTSWGRRKTEHMSFPKRDDPKYKFVRICREAGYSLKGAEQIKEEYVTADPDTWKLVAPEPLSRRDRLRRVGGRLRQYGERVLASAVMLTFIAFVVSAVYTVFVGGALPGIVTVLTFGLMLGVSLCAGAME